MTLTDLVPESADPDSLYAAFNDWAATQSITLYPHQDEALIEIVSGANVVLSTPTGSGKSLVATASHFAALAMGERSWYTAPIKALVSEKFFALCDIFGPASVGMMTGDGGVNATAPIVCCTAEVLANIALRDGADADADLVIMDEFHYYADPDRGWAWQVPLTFRFVLEPLHETIAELLATRQAPVYVVHFTQAAAIEQAQALMSVNVC